MYNKLLSPCFIDFFLLQIIQHSKKLYLIVGSVGRIPNSFVAESTCKWVDIQGRRVFPPPGFDDSGHKLTAESIHKSDLRLLRDDDECIFLYIFFCHHYMSMT